MENLENSVLTNPERMVFKSTKEETAWLLKEAYKIRCIREELEKELGLSPKDWDPIMGRYKENR